MENSIALMASGYLFARIGVLIAFGYLVYRVLQPSPRKVRIPTQSVYAKERSRATRLDR